MMVVALMVGISVIFCGRLVLLIPIVFTLAKETGKLCSSSDFPWCGLSSPIGLILPSRTEWPPSKIGRRHRNDSFIFHRRRGSPPPLWPVLFLPPSLQTHHRPDRGIAARLFAGCAPVFDTSAFFSFLTILAPLGLMMAATITDWCFRRVDSSETSWISPATRSSPCSWRCCCFYTFGSARVSAAIKISRSAKIASAAASIFWWWGGERFQQNFDYAGVDEAIARLIPNTSLPCCSDGSSRSDQVAVGSGHVSITNERRDCGRRASLSRRTGNCSGALGAGSPFLSHVNDGGFWFVERIFNMSVSDTLKS